MTEPSDAFKEQMLEPIEAMFRDALANLPPEREGRGRNFTGFPGPSTAISSGETIDQPPVSPPARSTDPVELEVVQAEIGRLVGLKRIKREIRRLAALAKVNQLRRKKGLPASQVSFHSLFIGNPGTGKTTVARLMGRALHAVGCLSNGHTVEVDKSRLVGGYLGQTPGIVAARIEEALGGVLFIDEAYSLLEDEMDAYGKEAMAGIVKAMEDHRADLVVIAAGYPGPMRKFLRTNPGLPSRFTRRLEFPDYSVEELQEILQRRCTAEGLTAPHGLLMRAELTWSHLAERSLISSGNARLVRSAFERMIENHAVRIARYRSPSTQDLIELRPEDWDGIEEALIEICMEG